MKVNRNWSNKLWKISSVTDKREAHALAFIDFPEHECGELYQSPRELGRYIQCIHNEVSPFSFVYGDFFLNNLILLVILVFFIHVSISIACWLGESSFFSAPLSSSKRPQISSLLLFWIINLSKISFQILKTPYVYSAVRNTGDKFGWFSKISTFTKGEPW